MHPTFALYLGLFGPHQGSKKVSYPDEDRFATLFILTFQFRSRVIGVINGWRFGTGFTAEPIVVVCIKIAGITTDAS